MSIALITSKEIIKFLLFNLSIKLPDQKFVNSVATGINI